MDGQREWVLDEQESRPFIRQAIEGGINFFDTADIYFFGGSEEILGRASRSLACRGIAWALPRRYSMRWGMIPISAAFPGNTFFMLLRTVCGG